MLSSADFEKPQLNEPIPMICKIYDGGRYHIETSPLIYGANI